MTTINSGDQQAALEKADEVAIITGAASGIGQGTALAFATLNYRLVLVDKQADKLAETSQLCLERSSRRHKVSVIFVRSYFRKRRRGCHDFNCGRRRRCCC